MSQIGLHFGLDLSAALENIRQPNISVCLLNSPENLKGVPEREMYLFHITGHYFKPSNTERWFCRGMGLDRLVSKQNGKKNSMP